MEHTLANPPPGSPRCWGRQFQENDPECKGCPFNLSCKKVVQQPAPMVYQQQTPYQAPYAPAQAVYQPPWTAPQPQPTYRLPVYQAVPPPPPAYHAPPPPPRPAYQAPAQPVYHAPAQPAPAPYQSIFGQYPGESVGERLGKNLVLRALEAIATEIARFFHFWDWPKRV